MLAEHRRGAPQPARDAGEAEGRAHRGLPTDDRVIDLLQEAARDELRVRGQRARVDHGRGRDTGGDELFHAGIAIAMLVQYMVSGTLWVEGRTRLRPPRLIGAGLLVAAATGLAAIVLGYPFLTTHTAHGSAPLIGEVHLPSATFFDLGVFAVVVGATLLILTALGQLDKQFPGAPANIKERATSERQRLGC